MGVEPYLVASTVEGILAQRLVRRLCSDCRRPVPVHQADLPPDFPKDESPDVIYEPAGCRECDDSGYSGRIGVFELLTTDEKLQEMCAENQSATRIRAHALNHGMTTLRQSGWEQVMAGVTSVEEVVRITRGDIIG
jgi:general secretion pathway protein E/type IV pilus assembly protein PilB